MEFPITIHFSDWFCFFCIFLFFGILDTPGSFWMFPASVLVSISSSTNPDSLYLRTTLETKIWVLDMFTVINGSSLPSPPLRSRRYMDAFLCVNISICNHVYLCCYCSVAQLCLTLYDPMDCSMPGFPVLHYLQEFVPTHLHWVIDANQPSHPLLSPLPAHNLSQHQGLFQWFDSPQQVAKILELQHQYQSFQSIFRVDFL